MTDFSIEVVLEMFFLFFSNSNCKFGAKTLIWRLYTATKALFIVKKMELINKYEFVEAGLDKNANIFIVYIIILEARELAMSMHIFELYY